MAQHFVFSTTIGKIASKMVTLVLIGGDFDHCDFYLFFFYLCYVF